MLGKRQKSLHRPRRTNSVRRQLKAISMSVGLARLQLAARALPQVGSTLREIHEDVQSLRRRLEKRRLAGFNAEKVLVGANE
jgi:hypothetical protein